jgi:hypothetical protein
MWQHTVNNSDWSEDDIIYDSRFNPLQLSDEDFASFINAALYRDTRSTEELKQLVEAMRPVLVHAGAEIVERKDFGVFEGYKIVDAGEAESFVETELSLPANWCGARRFRLFISHIAIEKDKATRLKNCLVRYGIDAFVAHEDIEPTLEWQIEIEKALRVMDAFLAIHTVGFAKSIWTQQEIGYAVGRGVKVISLQMGENPTGFISKRQALGRRGRKAEEIAAEIYTILSKDARTKGALDAAKVSSQ